MTEDKYFLYDVLESEKNMVVNLAIVINEASCQSLYDNYYKMFNGISKETKELFAYAYSNNWYSLESAPESKIKLAITKNQKEIDQLN